MKKPLITIFVTYFLIVPVLAHAQVDNLFDAIFGNNDRTISLERITVSQMEMIPDSPRDDQPVAFSVIIANDSNQSVKMVLAVVDNDRVVTQLNDVHLRPGNNRIDFPATNIQLSGGEQRCFSIRTDIDRRWVPIGMATDFCPESSRRDRHRRVKLSVERLWMTPDPASPGQEVSFEVRIKNHGRQIKGNIRIQDSDQVVVQTGTIRIPRGVSNFKLPNGQYTFQRMDTCFTVMVDVDRTSHQIDATEEYCATPAAWTLKSRHRGHKGDRDSHKGN